MKNTFKYILLGVLAALAFAGCAKNEFDTDQLGGDTTLSAFYPNPVMRGGALSIIGKGLDKVAEVQFTSIDEVAVKEFQAIKKGTLDTLEVIIPLEGPEVGPVSIKLQDGRILTSKASLSFTEPIEIQSFSPSTVYSGDILTIKGEYLNVVKEIIFPEDVYVTEFISQSRHELKVAVPNNAVSGKFILSDIDESKDGTSIPNKIYSGDFTVGKPTVVKAAKKTYKSGDVITVTGEHLDMIEKVDLEGAKEVEFSVAEDAKSITFNLPLSATDGNITLTSYAGDTFDAGEIETVTVTDLGIASLADDGRYKAGTEVEITGADLDLVTKVEFTNAEAAFSLSDGKIVAVVPAAAKDGNITVTLGSGKQAFTDAIEVVKPVVTGIDKTDAVAGADTLTVTGTDLDLVTEVKMGTKEQTFIPCEFIYIEEDGSIAFAVSEDAYSGIATLVSAAGYETTTSFINVTYDLAIDITFNAYEYQFGNPISVSGKNLMQVESILVKGKKITSYLERTDKSLSFTLPEGMGPGVYRLEITLIDGTQLTWPVPFSVVAPYTETFIWEGYEDLGSWSNQPYFGAEDAFINAGIKEGDQVRIYYTPLADWWQFQTIDGHWTNLELPELDGGYTVNPKNQEPGQPFFAFEVTPAVLAQLTSIQGWGGAMLSQGENVAITGISLIQFGAAPAKETVIWEGSEYTGDNYDVNLELGNENAWNEAEIESGNEVRIYFTTTDAEGWQIQVFDGHWSAMSELGLDGDNHNQFNAANSPDAVSNGYVSFTVTDEILAKLTSIQNWGSAIILQGKMVTFTKIVLKAGGGPAPVFEDTVWEGEEYSGDNYDVNLELGSETAWNDAGLAEGDTVKIYFTTTDAEGWQIQVFDGHWSAMSELGLDGDNHNQFNATNSPDAAANGYVTFKVTAEILAKLTSIQNWGSAIILQGKLVTFTKITKF